MILVAGESLIDLIADGHGATRAWPGGGPYNTARTIARLGQPTRFLGRMSADPFGRLLAGKLAGDRVELALPDPVAEPTALAVVSLSDAGVPSFWFHVAGTATFMLDQLAVRQAMTADVTAVHIGSLGLVAQPMATELETMVRQLPPWVLLLVDPNWRPQAIADAAAHRARLRRIMPRTDVLKLSTDDVAGILPGHGVPDAAAALLGWGARCVLVTDGPRPVRAFSRDAQLAVPVPPVELADTVGAGDAFGGAFLASWSERQLAREQLDDPALLRAALRAAVEVASLTCAKTGADPPWRHELTPGER